MLVLKINNDLNSILEQMDAFIFLRSADGDLFRYLEIDFQNLTFIHPNILGVIVAFIDKLRLDQKLKVNCINYSPENSDYISRMNFFSEIGYRYFESFSRHNPTGRFIPITRITERNRFSLPGKLTKIIVSQWNGIDESIIASIDWSIAEIIDNVFNHSQTPINGVVTAQYFPNKKYLDFVVIDGGIGIPKRLKQRQEYRGLSTLDALDKAVEKNITVDPENNVGAGLYYTKRIIEENRGILRINSDNAQLIVDSEGKKILLAPRWEGTIVQLRINTEIIIDPQKIWDNIPVSVMDYLFDGKLW